MSPKNVPTVKYGIQKAAKKQPETMISILDRLKGRLKNLSPSFPRVSLKPKRIIFNPGTENLPFAQQANAEGIETIEACTLVMLSVGNY